LTLLSENISEEYVSKEKLRQETPQERLEWMYKDMSPRQRILMHSVSMLTFVAAGVGIYTGVISVDLGDENAQKFIGAVLSIATGGMGTFLQFNIKDPKTKINK
jgi:hypothetical protein